MCVWTSMSGSVHTRIIIGASLKRKVPSIQRNFFFSVEEKIIWFAIKEKSWLASLHLEKDFFDLKKCCFNIILKKNCLSFDHNVFNQMKDLFD